MISGVSLPVKLAKKAKRSSMRKIPQCENKQEIPRGARLRVRLELGRLSVGCWDQVQRASQTSVGTTFKTQSR